MAFEAAKQVELAVVGIEDFAAGQAGDLARIEGPRQFWRHELIQWLAGNLDA